MGEETDGMATSVSKLREEMLALTKVDIMEDNGKTFKSTYDILLEISKVWDKLSDVSQANVLEKLAGKLRSNVVASIIQNTEDLQAAYETALDAEGSAAKENARYLESIDGKLKQLTTTWQQLWVDSIDSDTIKFFIDLGNEILKVIDALGGLDTILTTIAVSAFFSNIGKLPKLFSSLISPLMQLKDILSAASSMKDVGLAFIGKDVVGDLKAQKLATEGVVMADQELEAATYAVNAAMALQKIAINAGIAAFVILLQYIKKQREEEMALREETIQASEDSAKSYKELSKAYQEYHAALESNTYDEDALNNAIKNVNEALGNKAEQLEILTAGTRAYNEELERQLDNERKEAQGKSSEAVKKAQKTAEELYGKGGAAINGEGHSNDLILEYDSKQTQIKELQDQLDKAIEANDQKLQKSLTKQITRLEKGTKQVEDAALDLQQAYSDYVATHYDNAGFTQYDEIVDDMVKKFADGNEKYRYIFADAVKDALPDVAEGYEAANLLAGEINANISKGEYLKYQDVYDNYKQVLEEIKDLNVDMEQSMFGNIDTDTRQVIEWNKQKLEQFKDEIADWGFSPEELLGSKSTVLGAWENYNGVPVAFSPILQVPGGEPVLLSPDTMNKYLQTVVDAATDENGKVDLNKVLEFDASGTIPGFEGIKNMVADVGATAEHTAEVMHYMGTDGAYQMALDEINAALAETKLSFTELEDILENGIQDALGDFDADELKEAFSVDELKLMVSDAFEYFRSGATSIEDLRAALDDYYDSLEPVIDFQENFNDAINRSKEDIDNFQKDLSSLSTLITDAFDRKNTGTEFIDDLQTLSEQIAKLSNQSGLDLRAVDSIEELGEIAREVANRQLEELINKLNIQDTPLAEALRKAQRELINYQTAINSTVNSMSGLSSAYQTIRGAMDEYAEAGQLSFATLSSLLQLEPEYLSMLEMEDGQIRINQASLEALVEARKADAINATFAAEQAELDALAEQKAAEQAGYSASAHAALSDALAIAAGSYNAVASAAYNAAAAEAVAAANRASEAGATNAEIAAIQNKYANMRKNIASISVTSRKTADKVLGYANKAAKGASGAAKDAANDIKKEIDDLLSKWKQAVEDGGMTYKQYINQMKSLTDQYYREGKITADQYHDYQMQALREEMNMYKAVNSAVQDYLQEQKDALQEQKDAIEDQKDALQEQIDGINDKYDDLIKNLKEKIKKYEAEQDKIDAKIKKKNAKIEKIENKYDKKIEKNEKIIRQYEAQIRPLQAIVDKHQDIIDKLQRQIEDIEKNRRVYEYQIKDIERIKRENQYVIDELEHQQKVYEKQQKALERQIKVYQKQKDANDRIIKQLERQQKVYAKQQDALRDQIKLIQKQQKILEKMKNPYEDQIKALKKQKEELQKTNEERNRALSLQKAQYELDKAMYQRTAYVYTNGGFEYRADEEAISNAKENVQDVQYDISIANIDDQIDTAQAAIDAITDKIDGLQDVIDGLNDKIDSLQEPIDSIQVEIDYWNERNEQLSDNIQNIQDKIDELQIPIDELQDKIDALNDVNAEWDYKISKIQISIDALDDSIEQLNRRIQEQKDLMTPYERQIEDINKKIAKLEEKNKLLKEAEELATKAIQKQIDALEKQKDKYDEKIDKINKEIDKLEEERDKAVDAIEDQIKELDKQTKAIDKQIEAIDKYAKQWDKVIKMFERMKNEKLLEDMFGPDWKERLASLDPTLLEQFGAGYEDLCRRIMSASAEGVKGLDDVGEAASDAGGKAGGAAGEFGKLASAVTTGYPGSIPNQPNNAFTDKGGGYGSYGSTESRKGGGTGSGLVGKLRSAQQEIDITSSKTDAVQQKFKAANQTIEDSKSKADEYNNTIDNSVLPGMEIFNKSASKTNENVSKTFVPNLQIASKTTASTAEDVSKGAGDISASSTVVTGAVEGMSKAVNGNFKEVQTYASKTKQVVTASVGTINNNTNKLKTTEKILENITLLAEKMKKEAVKQFDETKKEADDTKKKISKSIDDIKKKISDGAKDTKKSSDLIKKYVSLSDSQGLYPAVKSVNEFIAKYLKGNNGIINNSKLARDKTTKYFNHNSSEGLGTAINSIKDFINNYLNGDGGIKNQSRIARELIKTHWEGSALETVKNNINNLIELLEQLKSSSEDAKSNLNELKNVDTSGLEDKKKACDSLKDSAEKAKKAIDDLNKTEIKPKNTSTGGAGNNTVAAKGARVRVDHFAKGGRIKKPNLSQALNTIAESVGEDTMIAAREGEGVFTERQTDDLEEFIKLTPELIESSKSLQKYSKLFTGLNLSSSTAIPLAQSQIASGMKGSVGVPESALASNVVDSNNIEITIGDIQVNGVQDVNGLAMQIKNNLPSALLQAINRR